MRKWVRNSLIVTIGFLVGTVVTASYIGLYYGTNPKGIFNVSRCYKGRQVVLALGTPNNLGFMHVNVPEWGPPYFRVKMDAWTWPGGALGFNRNNVGICADTANEDTIYEAKAGWIESHPAEWMAYLKTDSSEGKTWYGRRWKSVLRKINQQTAAQ